MKIKNNEILSEMLKESKMERLGFEYLLEAIYATMVEVDLFYQREGDIFSMILNGATLEEVGKKHNITRERVRQIFIKSLRRAKYAIKIYADERKKIEEYKKRIEVLEAENTYLRKLNGKDAKEDMNLTLVEDLDLSFRTKRSLLYAEIKTVEELRNTPAIELLRLRNFGRRSIMEIRDFFKREYNEIWE